MSVIHSHVHVYVNVNMNRIFFFGLIRMHYCFSVSDGELCHPILQFIEGIK